MSVNVSKLHGNMISGTLCGQVAKVLFHNVCAGRWLLSASGDEPGLLHMLPPEPGGFLFNIPAGVTCFFTFLLREGRTVWYVPFAWGRYDRNG